MATLSHDDKIPLASEIPSDPDGRISREQHDRPSRASWGFRSTAAFSDIGDFEAERDEEKEDTEDQSHHEDDLDLKKKTCQDVDSANGCQLFEYKTRRDSKHKIDMIASPCKTSSAGASMANYNAFQEKHTNSEEALVIEKVLVIRHEPIAQILLMAYLFTASCSTNFSTMMLTLVLHHAHDQQPQALPHLSIYSFLSILSGLSVFTFGVYSDIGQWHSRIRLIQLGALCYLLSCTASALVCVSKDGGFFMSELSILSYLASCVGFGLTIPNLFVWGMTNIGRHIVDTRAYRRSFCVHVVAVFFTAYVVSCGYVEYATPRGLDLFSPAQYWNGCVYFSISVFLSAFVVLHSALRSQSQVTQWMERPPIGFRIITRLGWKSSRSFQLLLTGLALLCFSTVYLIGNGLVGFFSRKNLNQDDDRRLWWWKTFSVMCMMMSALLFIHLGSMQLLKQKPSRFFYAPLHHDAESKSTISRQDVMHYIALGPIGTCAVYMGFIEAQFSSTLILQACQTNLQVWHSSTTIHPEFLSLVVVGISLCAIPMVNRLLSTSASQYWNLRHAQHIAGGILMSTIALFIAVIVDLHRRSSDLLLPIVFSSTCHKEQHNFSISWLVPVVLLFGFAQAIFNVGIHSLFYSLSRPETIGASQGLLFLFKAIGYTLASGTTSLLHGWYDDMSSTNDLVMILLLITVFGCSAYSGIMNFTFRIERSKFLAQN